MAVRHGYFQTWGGVEPIVIQTQTLVTWYLYLDQIEGQVYLQFKLSVVAQLFHLEMKFNFLFKCNFSGQLMVCDGQKKCGNSVYKDKGEKPI